MIKRVFDNPRQEEDSELTSWLIPALLLLAAIVGDCNVVVEWRVYLHDGSRGKKGPTLSPFAFAAADAEIGHISKMVANNLKPDRPPHAAHHPRVK